MGFGLFGLSMGFLWGLAWGRSSHLHVLCFFSAELSALR